MCQTCVDMKITRLISDAETVNIDAYNTIESL